MKGRSTIMGMKNVYEQPAMVVVALQPSEAMLDMSKRKSYEVIDDNPFAGNSDEGSSGVKELTDPNLWDEEW